MGDYTLLRRSLQDFQTNEAQSHDSTPLPRCSSFFFCGTVFYYRWCRVGGLKEIDETGRRTLREEPAGGTGWVRTVRGIGRGRGRPRPQGSFPATVASRSRARATVARETQCRGRRSWAIHAVAPHAHCGAPCATVRPALRATGHRGGGVCRPRQVCRPGGLSPASLRGTRAR